MILKMLKKDMLEKKIITIAIDVPHYVQYHSDEIDRELITKWSSANELVKDQPTSVMINIDGAKIYFGNNIESEADTVMDLAFVKQNESFDYLLNLNNKRIEVGEGEIAILIFLWKKRDLN